MANWTTLKAAIANVIKANGNQKKNYRLTSSPSASDVGSGFMYYDTTNKRMLLSNGASWVNMDGTPLA